MSWRAAHDANESLQHLMAPTPQLNSVEHISRPSTANLNPIDQSQQQWQSDGSFNYMMDATQQQPQAPQTPQRRPSQQHPGQQPHQPQPQRRAQQSFQERISAQFAAQNGDMASQQQPFPSGAYTPALATPSIELQNLSMHSPANLGASVPTSANSAHDQHSMQSAYTVSAGPPSADFQQNDMQQQRQQNYVPANSMGSFGQSNNQTQTANTMSHAGHMPLDFGAGNGTHHGHPNYDFGAFYATPTTTTTQ